MATGKGIIRNRGAILARNCNKRLGMPCPFQYIFLPFESHLLNMPGIYRYI